MPLKFLGGFMEVMKILTKQVKKTYRVLISEFAILKKGCLIMKLQRLQVVNIYVRVSVGYRLQNGLR